jgi:hypothetical protein
MAQVLCLNPGLEHLAPWVLSLVPVLPCLVGAFSPLGRRPAFRAVLRVHSSPMLLSFRRRSAFLTGALLVAGGLLAAFLLWAGWTIAWAYSAAPGIVARHLASRPVVVTPGDLPPGGLDMLLRVEDPRFFSHHGVDLSTPGAGYTTITQGIVKFLFFDRFRPGLAKIRQTLIALAVDRRIDKRTQLTVLLSSAYMGSTPEGREIHGFAEAARVDYGKDLRSLSRREVLSLVALLVAPNTYSPVLHPAESAERVRRIERLLAGACAPLGLADVELAGCR